MQKERQNIDPKSFKNLAESLQDRGLEGFRAALGRFWATGGFPDASKAPLGSLLGRFLVEFTATWRCVGASRGGLGGSLGCLGASWARLGASLGSLGPDFRSKKELN